MIPAMIPRPMPRALPWHWAHGQADCSSLDTAHARRLCARTGLDPGQKCIYCDTRCATSILWPFGGGAACFTCTDTARSRGLQGLDLVRVDRWLQSLCWSKTGRWKTVLAPNCAGHLIAPYMVHLHQNRGNIWIRLVGWTTLYPSPDPAPAWRAAVAAHGGLADASAQAHAASVHAAQADVLTHVCRIVERCKQLAEEATNSLPFVTNTQNNHRPDRRDGPHRGRVSRREVMKCLLCRLLLMDAGEPSGETPRDAPPSLRDQRERHRVHYCAITVAAAAAVTEGTRRALEIVRMGGGPRRSPVPGDIRTFELNVADVVEHIEAEHAARLQSRIRALARQWWPGMPRDDETTLLNEMHEDALLLDRALAEPIVVVGPAGPIVVGDSSDDGD